MSVNSFMSDEDFEDEEQTKPLRKRDHESSGDDSSLGIAKVWENITIGTMVTIDCQDRKFSVAGPQRTGYLVCGDLELHIPNMIVRFTLGDGSSSSKIRVRSMAVIPMGETQRLFVVKITADERKKIGSVLEKVVVEAGEFYPRKKVGRKSKNLKMDDVYDEPVLIIPKKEVQVPLSVSQEIKVVNIPSQAEVDALLSHPIYGKIAIAVSVRLLKNAKKQEERLENEMREKIIKKLMNDPSLRSEALANVMAEEKKNYERRKQTEMEIRNLIAPNSEVPTTLTTAESDALDHILENLRAEFL